MAVMPMRVAMGLLGGWHAPIVAPKTVNWTFPVAVPCVTLWSLWWAPWFSRN